MSLCVCTFILSLFLGLESLFLIIAASLLIMTVYKIITTDEEQSVFGGLQTLGVTWLHLPGQSPQAASSSPSSASYILWGSMGHLFKHRTFMSSHRLFLYLGALGTIDLTPELPLMA